MQLAPHRIAQSGNAAQQHAHRLHCGKAAGPACHRAQHAVLCASVAILCIKRIADKAAVARLARQMPGKGANLTLETPHSSREQRRALGDAGVGYGQAGGEIVSAIEHEVDPRNQVADIVRRDPLVGYGDVQSIVR